MAVLTIRSKLTALVAFVALAYTPLTAAQSAPFRFEITPFAAYRVGGDFTEQDGSTEFELDESSAYGFTINGKVAADDNGADIAHISRLLGHEHLDSTAVYLRVAITRLKKAHAASHPREQTGEKTA